MPAISDRPYVGTWRNNMRQVVRHTPDALVFVNGDVAIPGCETCRGRIDLQKYVTGISVDAGTLPGSLSATVTLSVPKISGDQLFRDGYNKLYPGLEINIYMRGYFPMTGFFGATPPDALPKISLREGEDIDWAKTPSYPYYPVFHGVVTNVSNEYSGGEYHANMSCASLLHFWQYHNMITSQSYYGTRADNSPVRQSMMGNDYNGMHPFAIIYNLYRTTQGAAGGVQYALEEQSNLDAAADSVRKDDGKSLWSFTQDYWAQRFRSRIQNLRMYGVNGNLFNAAQQAFLGKRNHGDLQNLLKNAQFMEDGSLRDTRDPFSGDLAVAKALGFDRSGFDFVFAPNKNPDAAPQDSINEGPASLSLLDMYAFTQQSQDIGSMNIMESTYETKLQMAEAVMEATGYEFYQDVDGDLIFKPPFYNLDVSSNRVYRIEDIDIISISEQHAEPEATWIRVKLTWFKGTQGFVAVDGATNRTATFVDWGLVAQFGWKPANIEISYTTDVRSAFFIGQARLDLLNINVNSASVTIPIRPEMRPGIPVYIPFIDCFYYVSQFNHGFQFGGQCLTNLTLTCRRRKFFAPGLPQPPAPGQSVLDLIQLDRPDLPQRPIRIHDNGLPRLAGFPNVVMALDPRRLNPKFLSVGAGLPHLDSTEDISLFFNLLREDLRSIPSSPFQEVPASQSNDPTQAPNESTQFRLQISENKWIQFSIEDLAASYNDLQNAQKEVNRIKTSIETQRNKLWFQTQSAIGTSSANKSPTLASNTSFQALQQELLLAEAALANVTESGVQGRTFIQEGDLTLEQEGVNDGNLFATVIQIADMARGQPSRRKVDGIPDSDITASQLDQLENLKSSYTANALPGYYRYYSASHPNPAMQGQEAVFFNSKDRSKSAAVSTGTGGGAASTSGPPKPAAQQDFNVDAVNTDGLSEAQALQAKLKATGVTFTSAASLLSFRNNGGDQKRRKNAKMTVEEYKNIPLSEEQSNNLANISTAAQELVNRWNANPATEAFRSQEGGRIIVSGAGAWRPYSTSEDSGKVSQHALGRALDLPLRPKKSETAPENIAAYNQAYQALVDAGMSLWQEGKIGGFGIYPHPVDTPETVGKGVGFVHIDVRPDVGAWYEWEGKRQTPVNGCRLRDPDENGNFTPNPRGTHSMEGCEWIAGQWTRAGIRDISEISSQRRNRIRPFPEKGQKEPPKVGEPPPPEPVPEPAPPETAEVTSTSAIQLVPIDLPVPKQVVGFVEPTVDDPQLRPPEADIGLVHVTKGLIIAKGPDKSPAVVSTDLIQTFQFTQWRQTTDTGIRGDTQNGGDYTFRRVEFKKLLSQRFFRAAQENDPIPSSTPQELFEELWNLLRAELSENPPDGPAAQVPLPRYNPDNPSTNPDINLFEQAYLGAALPAFNLAVTSAFSTTGNSEATVRQEASTQLTSIGISSADVVSEDLVVDDFQFASTPAQGLSPPQPTTVLLTQQVSIAGVVLANLKTMPQFAAPSGVTKQGRKGQNFNATIRKLADAYAEYITRVFELSFDGLQVLAMEPGKGREMRLSNLTGSLDAAAIVALDQIEFKATEKGKRTIKVEKFAKIGKPIHTPVIPISDAGGYEHFGHYRYGRGITIEPGGSFAFLHNNDDPFGRLSATAAEELVDLLSSIKQDHNSAKTDEFKKSAQASLAARINEIREEEDALQRQEAVNNLPPEERTVAQAQLDREIQSRAELRIALAVLMQTQTGQQAVNELLTTNPTTDGSVEVIDVPAGVNATQLEIKFSNFAASYTKDASFKTSVANSAYRLVDLTSYLQSPDLQACSCKGYTNDVALLAFGRLQFLAVDGINPEDQPAEAFVAEQMLLSSVDFFYQQKALRGEVLDPNQVPNAGSFEGVKHMIGTGLSNVRTGFTSTVQQFSDIPEQFRSRV